MPCCRPTLKGEPQARYNECLWMKESADKVALHIYDKEEPRGPPSPNSSSKHFIDILSTREQPMDQVTGVAKCTAMGCSECGLCHVTEDEKQKCVKLSMLLN